MLCRRGWLLKTKNSCWRLSSLPFLITCKLYQLMVLKPTDLHLSVIIVLRIYLSLHSTGRYCDWACLLVDLFVTLIVIAQSVTVRLS